MKGEVKVKDKSDGVGASDGDREEASEAERIRDGGVRKEVWICPSCNLAM